MMRENVSRHFYDLVVEFETYLKVERNFSERTIHIYKFELRKLIEYLIRTIGHDPSIETVDVKQLRGYIEYIQIERNYKASTLSRIIATMKSFFRFCREREYIKISPTDLIRIPKQARKLPIYLVYEELIQLMDAPDKKTDIGIRDYAIIVTLSMTGIRRQELVNANVYDVDFNHETLKVFGKGAKERIVPLNQHVLNALRSYLDRRPITETEALFVNMNNRKTSFRPAQETRRLSSRSVDKIVKKYIRISGIRESKISPHKLRHTFATLLHLNDVDILEIQKLLGHSAITSTQIYTHTNPEKLKKAVDKLDKL